MKNRISRSSLFVAAGVLSGLPWAASLAADNTPTTAQPTATQPAVATGAPSGAAATTTTSATTASAPVKLPYGVEDVLKLSRAQINEEIIVNYIQNSGTIYSLGPQDIVYLRNEGVSDRVVNTMLDQRKVVAAESAAQTAAAAPAPQAVPYPDTGAVPAAPIYAPTYCQPACAEVETAPSTVYVIPYPQATAAYYGAYQPSSYAYYGGSYPSYGGYCGPRASFVYRFGGGGHFHGGHSHGWRHH